MGIKTLSDLYGRYRSKLSYPNFPKIMVEIGPKIVRTKGSALLQIMPGDLHTSLCNIHWTRLWVLHTHFDLTNTCIRECMAIIKIDKEAFEQLNAFADVIVSEQEPELCVYSKTLAKSCFNLQCEHGRN